MNTETLLNAIKSISESHVDAYQAIMMYITRAEIEVLFTNTTNVKVSQRKGRTGKGTPTHASVAGTYQRFNVNGHSACAVLRQLGYQGLSVKTAHAAMLANGYDVSATTAAIQVGNGRKLKANGQPLPAMLTDAQYDAFMAQYHEAT